MRPLGLYLSFISVLTVAYSLFLRIHHDRAALVLLGGLIGFADLAAAYMLMQERRTGLALGLFLFGLTLGLSGYFLSLHYFGPVRVTVLPDLVIVFCSLVGFLTSLLMSPFRHPATPYTHDKHTEQQDMKR